MARVLELFDETGDSSKPTGETATLTDEGRVMYQGQTVQSILGKWLAVDSPDSVFDNMRGWSNGYVSLREKDVNNAL